jgi:hypothetical protein
MNITVRKSTINQRTKSKATYIGVAFDQEAELYDGHSYVFQTYLAPVFITDGIIKVDHAHGKGFHYTDVMAMYHMNHSKFVHNAPWMKRHAVENGEFGDKFQTCKFRDSFTHIIEMLDWVEGEGGSRNLFGYNLMSDLKSMSYTDTVIPGKKTTIRGKPITSWPNSGINKKGWSTIKFQDVLGMTLMRCPKMLLSYISWVRNLSEIDMIKFSVNGKYGCKLEHYSKYISDDTTYIQKHGSPQDVDDLVHLMNKMYSSDGKFWDDHNYLPVNTTDLFSGREVVLCT